VARKGVPFTEAHKEALRQLKIGKKRAPFSLEHRRKIAAAQVGKSHKRKTSTL
jgi:hypothetical protein